MSDHELPMVRRPEPFFGKEEHLRVFCSTSSARLEEYSMDISIAAVQIQKALGQIPDGTLVGVTSKIKAQLVVAHLKLAASVLDSAAGYAGGAWFSYCQRYKRERDEAASRRAAS